MLFSCVPCVVIAGGTASKIMAKMSSRGQLAYAEAGNVVEQTVGSIRTVSKNKLLEVFNMFGSFVLDLFVKLNRLHLSLERRKRWKITIPS